LPQLSNVEQLVQSGDLKQPDRAHVRMIQD